MHKKFTGYEPSIPRIDSTVIYHNKGLNNEKYVPGALQTSRLFISYFYHVFCPIPILHQINSVISTGKQSVTTMCQF